MRKTKGIDLVYLRSHQFLFVPSLFKLRKLKYDWLCISWLLSETNKPLARLKITNPLETVTKSSRILVVNHRLFACRRFVVLKSWKQCLFILETLRSTRLFVFYTSILEIPGRMCVPIAADISQKKFKMLTDGRRWRRLDLEWMLPLLIVWQRHKNTHNGAWWRVGLIRAEWVEVSILQLWFLDLTPACVTKRVGS